MHDQRYAHPVAAPGGSGPLRGMRGRSSAGFNGRTRLVMRVDGLLMGTAGAPLVGRRPRRVAASYDM